MKSVVFISWQNEFNKKIVHFREFVYYFDHQAAKTKRWENLKMQTICRQNQTLKSANSLNGYLRFNNVVPPVLISGSASFVIYLKKSCKCLTFKLGVWKFHFFFIYSNQSGTVKLFYLCFTPSSRRNPTKNNITN